MTVPLNKLFRVDYGSKLDFNKMQFASRREGGINFVGRSSQHHGITGTIKPIAGVSPFPTESITVALGGSKLLTSFVQLAPFYTAQNVAVLQEIAPMTIVQKLFICLCIRHNRFRYSAFGREANRTLRTLPVPALDEFPDWLATMSIDALSEDHSAKALQEKVALIQPANWINFTIGELFEIKKGVRITQAEVKPGPTPFVTAIEANNGIRQRISVKPKHKAGLITVNYNGSVAEAFYQPEDFVASDDVNVLYPRFKIDELIALFICTIIRREKYRYNYGRKWNLERMNESKLRLPALPDGRPDWQGMRRFMQTLPYSGAVVGDRSMINQ